MWFLFNLWPHPNVKKVKKMKLYSHYVWGEINLFVIKLFNFWSMLLCMFYLSRDPYISYGCIKESSSPRLHFMYLPIVLCLFIQIIKLKWKLSNFDLCEVHNVSSFIPLNYLYTHELEVERLTTCLRESIFLPLRPIYCWCKLSNFNERVFYPSFMLNIKRKYCIVILLLYKDAFNKTTVVVKY
jgi:hypothetical protein